MAAMLQLALLISIVGGCFGSECCVGYYSLTGVWHDPQWCSDYCCGSSSIALTCCSNILLEAAYDDRADYCILWWQHHIWAPIIVAVVSLLLIACCCYCYYKCCCAPRDRTVVVQQPGMMPGVNIQQISTSQQQSSMNFGYDQPKY